MKRRDVLPLLGGAVAVWPLAARAQQRSIPLVGLLVGSSPANEAEKLAGFREGLERLGYVEGRTIRLEVRYAEGVPERFDSIARELVALAFAHLANGGAIILDNSEGYGFFDTLQEKGWQRVDFYGFAPGVSLRRSRPSFGGESIAA